MFLLFHICKKKQKESSSQGRGLMYHPSRKGENEPEVVNFHLRNQEVGSKLPNFFCFNTMSQSLRAWIVDLFWSGKRGNRDNLTTSCRDNQVGGSLSHRECQRKTIEFLRDFSLPKPRLRIKKVSCICWWWWGGQMLIILLGAEKLPWPSEHRKGLILYWDGLECELLR